MAKKEHQDNVTGGLTTGLDFPPVDNMPEGEIKQQQTPVIQQQATSPLTEGYQQVHKKNIESRSAKLNILVKPSTAQHLNDAVKNGEIRSRNDLINYLLEKYFEEKNAGVDQNT